MTCAIPSGLTLNATLAILGYTTSNDDRPFGIAQGRKHWFRNGRYLGSFTADEGWRLIERGCRKFAALGGGK